MARECGGPREGSGGQIDPRKTKQNPRNSKEKGLDFLGFLWPKRDFSMGYSEYK
jgi:hypothetical protein